MRSNTFISPTSITTACKKQQCPLELKCFGTHRHSEITDAVGLTTTKSAITHHHEGKIQKNRQ